MIRPLTAAVVALASMPAVAGKYDGTPLAGVGASVEGSTGTTGLGASVELSAMAGEFGLVSPLLEAAAGYDLVRRAARLRGGAAFHIAALGVNAGLTLTFPTADWRSAPALAAGASLLLPIPPIETTHLWANASLQVEVALDGRVAALFRLTIWRNLR